MVRERTTRDLSDRHAEHIEALFGAPATRGSGNQSNRPTDNRMPNDLPYAFAFEGKATRATSISVRLADWTKLVEQAHDLRPALAFRFYAPDDRLFPLLDLVAVRADDFAELLELANGRT